MGAPLVRARVRRTICLMENYGFFMIFDDFQGFSQRWGLKAKVKVKAKVKANPK